MKSMKVIYGLGKGIKGFDRPYAALGIFDGLHLGHRHVLESMVRSASRHNKKTLCITFFPHPSKILSSKNIFVHLISLSHRIRLIEQLDIDACVVINFNRHFSRISPQGFIDSLKKKVNPAVIFVGSNWTFGRGGVGRVRLLKKLAQKYDFKVQKIPPLKMDNRIISSTLIRSLIKKGNLDLAGRYLGRGVSVLGKVVRGKRIGQKLGYHTANIDAEHEVIPPPGIYAVKVKIDSASASRGRVKNKEFAGAAYIGTSPTMHFYFSLPRLEVYILNFHKNIYGKIIEVEFIKKIREEKKFPSLASLSSQIKKDVVKVRSILFR